MGPSTSATSVPIGLLVLVSSLLANLLTVSAEIGGVALILQLVVDAPSMLFALLGALGLVAIIWFTPFAGLERLFGYVGLALFVFVAAALYLGPDWHSVARGFMPQATSSTLYWYLLVALMAAAPMPYEDYFSASVLSRSAGDRAACARTA